MHKLRGSNIQSRFRAALHSWRVALFIIASILGAYVIRNNFHQVREGLSHVQQARLWMLGVAVLSIAGTFVSATTVYWMLSRRKLTYGRMLQMEIAGGFTSHLLPAGLGGIATNMRYLSKAFASKTRAATTIALNNVLSFLSYVSAAIVVALLTHQPLNTILRIHIPMLVLIFLGLAVVLATLLAIYSQRIHRLVQRMGHQMHTMLNEYRQSPLYILGAFGSAFVTTLLYISALFLCAHALGTTISFLQAFIAFTLGITGSAITPTPGGLGGVELGLYTGLYSTGVGRIDALAIVLLFRLLAFWLPIIPGFFMFRRVLKRHMI